MRISRMYRRFRTMPKSRRRRRSRKGFIQKNWMYLAIAAVVVFMVAKKKDQ